MSKSEEHIHLRFQAVVIASQLPDNTAEALLVLDYARHMVVEFLGDSSAVSDTSNAFPAPLKPSLLRRRACATGLPSSDHAAAGGAHFAEGDFLRVGRHGRGLIQ